MSSRPDLARLATEALAREPVAVRPHTAAERDRTIAALTRAMHSDARRRGWTRTAAVSTFAVAAGIAALFVIHARSKAPSPALVVAAADVEVHATREAGGVRVWSGTTEKMLDDESPPLATGDRIVADDEGAATLRLSTGTVLRLAGGGDLTVASRSAEQRFALEAGSVRADVAKVSPAHRFLVTTRDAEVEVHGTSFRVSVVPPVAACGAGTRTRVAVFEGVVAVRSGASETLLRAGDEWPRGCSVAPAAAVPSSTGSAARPHRVTASRAAPDTAAPPPAPSPVIPVSPSSSVSPSELALENALYGEAAGARRRGDERAAIAGYESFIARYPNSALAENCAAERMRLLAARDPRQGIDAARAYLARYPNGFARDEAASIASSRR